jgi:hypothetical protein
VFEKTSATKICIWETLGRNEKNYICHVLNCVLSLMYQLNYEINQTTVDNTNSIDLQNFSELKSVTNVLVSKLTITELDNIDPNAFVLRICFPEYNRSN